MQPQIRQNTSDPRGSETPDEDRRFPRRRQSMAGHTENVSELLTRVSAGGGLGGGDGKS